MMRCGHYCFFTLPYNWKTLVISLSNFAPKGVLSLGMVKNLFNEEARIKDTSTSNEYVLVTENSEDYKTREKLKCYHYGRS